MSYIKHLETAAIDLLEIYEIDEPPIPIETMLRNPRDNMWKQVDINQLSGTFLSIKDQFSPRMSLARLLVRHIVKSDWGRERELEAIFVEDEELLHAFARMLIMPAPMVEKLSSGARNPMAISLKFEVPEDDARIRLSELAHNE